MTTERRRSIEAVIRAERRVIDVRNDPQAFAEAQAEAAEALYVHLQRRVDR